MTDAQEVPLRIFAAFAGGGAKGIVHVGALKALEEQDVQFCGVAGTSAGAIVASLKAAGFTASEIVSDGDDILTRIRQVDPSIAKLTDLFGPRGWLILRAFRWIAGSPVWLGRLLGGLLILLLPASFILGGKLGYPAVCWIAGAWLTFLLAAWLVWREFSSGLVRLETLRGVLGKLLNRQLFPNDPDRVVCMRDFGHSGRPSLKIVSSNLTNRSLYLFSPEKTPDVAVADAVIASICIPGLFEAHQIGNDLHVDGGLVSNLPAWPFDEERELDPDALTIAFEITENKPEAPVRGKKWIRAAIKTALFGSGELNLRANGRSELVELRTDIGVLDFDLTKEQMLKAVADADAAASKRLVERVTTIPNIYRKACEATRQSFETLFESQPTLLKGGRRRGHVRVALAIRDPQYFQSLRLRYGAGYRGHTDERLLLPIEGTIVGQAWAERVPQFAMTEALEKYGIDAFVDTYRRSLVWRELEWILCVPISKEEAEDPLFVVIVDGNAPLAVGPGEPEEDTLDAFREALENILHNFENVLVELDTVENGQSR